MFHDFAADEAQSFHQKRASFNLIRMAPATPPSDWQADMDNEHTHRQAEGQFLEARAAKSRPFA